MVMGIGKLLLSGSSKGVNGKEGRSINSPCLPVGLQGMDKEFQNGKQMFTSERITQKTEAQGEHPSSNPSSLTSWYWRVPERVSFLNRCCVWPLPVEGPSSPSSAFTSGSI